MKPAAIVGLLIILSAMAFGAKAFVTNLTPYLTFTQARQASNGTVQIMGPLDKSSVQSDASGLRFVITAKDNPADRMTVLFKESKPSNFNLAIEVTAIGRYVAGTTPNGGVFHADKLLVKCPSKYQGTETKEYGTK
ncbi:MAG: cytochrome c maturation protein CcmE [Akkermansiaceae bacterium]|nr:cytochrome c maturation protein CcmE [Armatimonadota bacterium]